MALLRGITACLAAVFTLSLPAVAGVPIPARVKADAPAEELMLDALGCIAAVLTFHTAEGKVACGHLIEALPDDVLGYKFRGLAYLLEHDFPNAEADFRIALRLDPGDAEIQAGYGQALSGEGRYAEAIPVFDEALRLAPTDIRFLAARCWARTGEGSDLDQALADCDRALELAPGFSSALHNRGMVHLKRQEYPAAIADYSAALADSPGAPAPLFGRGLAYLHSGDPERARADIDAARQDDPTIDRLFVRLGILPPGCLEPDGACPLPPALRRPALPPGGRLVSFTPPPSGNVEIPDMVDIIALGRMNIMLWDTSLVLGIPLTEEALESDDRSNVEIRRHLARVQREYERQQKIACDAEFLTGYLCRPAHFERTFSARERTLQGQIERTLDILYPFWVTMCRRDPDGWHACQIE